MSAVAEDQALAPPPAAVRKQLGLLLDDEHLRTSRRSVAFLRYIVEETLLGRAEELKERTIGVHVFGKVPTYDTNLDHVVRTAALELRKRLNLYYSEEAHRDEVRIQLVPGSYVPQIWPAPPTVEADSARPEKALVLPLAGAEVPSAESQGSPELHARGGADAGGRRQTMYLVGLAAVLLVAVSLAFVVLRPGKTEAQRFWQPLLRNGEPVLIALGDVPQGPPVSRPDAMTTPAPTLAGHGPPTVPFADAVAAARVASVLASSGKKFLIRREDASSFADLREGPLVLVGAFNNGWSLRLLRDLRFSLAMDAAQRVLYIRDRDHPDSRAWQWSIDPHPEEKERVSSKPLHDYALVSRVLDSETGRDVVVIGGLYAYGTEAAGEFVTDPEMTTLPRKLALGVGQKRVQIVLETQVSDGTAGPPRVVAVSVE